MNRTRLSMLCKLHDVQGGTIFQFNRQYDTDFLALNEADFLNWYHIQIQNKVVFGRLFRYGWIKTGIYKGNLEHSHWEYVQYRECD